MSNFLASFKNALKSLSRNLSVTLASVATVSATILIFGVFLMVALTINGLVETVEEQTVVRVFLNETVTEAEKSELEGILRATEGVSGVLFEDKVTAFQNAKASLGEDSNLLDGFSADKDNPYPSSYIITLDKPERAAGVVKAATGQRGVESVANDSETVNTLINWAKTIRLVGVIIFAILILISLFLIGNSIKLAVFGRRQEIEIMKFVGATNWFIRWPFIIEGIVIGLLGAAVAVVVLYFSYRYAYTQARISLPFVSLTHPSVIINWLSWQFALAGMVIGALGSFLSIRKHLNV